MKILIINYTDKAGGAARATWRLFQCLTRHHQNQDVSYAVIDKTDDDSTVLATPLTTPGHFFWHQERWVRDRLSFRNATYHSFNIFGSPLRALVNSINADIVHMNWIGNGTLSLRDLSKLKAKTIFWTLHDEWAFHGAEHYHDPLEPDAYSDGYKSSTRPWRDKLINRFVWLLKSHYYRSINNRLHVITPSQWMRNRIEKNTILKPKALHIVPYPIDTSIFKPQDKAAARLKHHMPLDKKIILFGADTADTIPAKGYKKLVEAISQLKNHVSPDDCAIYIFGRIYNPIKELGGIPVFYLGHLKDDHQIAAAYAAADVMVVPSLIDNAPQTVTESLACGTAVAAFKTCGIPEYIRHRETGYLAEAFDTTDLAKAIAYILENSDSMRDDCVKSVAGFSYEKIADRHFDLYRDAFSA